MHLAMALLRWAWSSCQPRDTIKHSTERGTWPGPSLGEGRLVEVLELLLDMMVGWFEGTDGVELIYR